MMTVATASCALTTSPLPALPEEAEACKATAMQAVSLYMPIVV